MPLRLLPVLFAVVVLLLSGSPAAAQAAKGKKYALLVGVLKYDHASLPNLDYTENDVEELARLLRQPGSGFTEVVVLTTTRGRKNPSLAPTAKNIRTHLRKFTDKVKKHDLLIVGLSGHGLQLTVTDPNTKKEKEEGFFCPADAKPRSNQALADLKKTMISLVELFKELEESGAGVKLLLVDACRNEAGQARNVDVDTLPRPPQGFAALFSCKSGERAHETKKLGKGHGVFFYHVIQALEGKAVSKSGEVNWNGFTDYVTRNVSTAVPKLIGGGARQTPHEIKNLVGTSPVLLADTGTEARRLFQLGAESYLGSKGKLDWTRAYRLFRQSADRGHVEARAMVGIMLVFGQGTEPDQAEGRKLFESALPRLREAADTGDSLAQVMLAFQYRDGKILRRDHAEALKWLQKAANAGLPIAMWGMGLLYAYGQGVDQDDKKAVEWFRKGADKGEPRSLVELGTMYANGRGVGRDDRRAVAFYRKAAEIGFARGNYYLGWMYLDGRGGLKRDHGRALECLCDAVEKGDGAALHTLGFLYATGRGVERNDKQAVVLFRKASARGELAATDYLGFMYENGRGVEKDYRKALACYRKAAAKGLASAQYHLASAYEDGRGVTRNRAEALKWYRKAADAGEEEAKKKVRELEKTER